MRPRIPIMAEDEIDHYRLTEEIIERVLRQIFPKTKNFKITVRHPHSSGSQEACDADLVMQFRADKYKFQVPQKLTEVLDIFASSHFVSWLSWGETR